MSIASELKPGITWNKDPVATDLGFPEGPVAMPDGSLIFVDIKKETLSRWTAGQGVEVVANIEGGPNGAALGPDGAIYICNNGGVYAPFQQPAAGPLKGLTLPNDPPLNYAGGSIQKWDPKTREVTTLYDHCEGEPLPAPDDLVFEDAGGFWFTCSGYQARELKNGESVQTGFVYGGLYYAPVDGTKIVKAAQIPSANGVGLSPDGKDGKTVYVSDTIFGRLWAFALVKPGVVTPIPKPLPPGRVVQTLPSFVSPLVGRTMQWVDSLAVDVKGNVYVGTIFNGGITIFDPATGDTQHVPTPAPDMFTTNLCFGGEDMMDVWVTASSTGMIYQGRSNIAGKPPEWHGK